MILLCDIKLLFIVFVYIYIVYKSQNESGIARNVMSILFRNYTQNFLSKNNKLALVLCMCYVQIFIKIGFLFKVAKIHLINCKYSRNLLKESIEFQTTRGSPFEEIPWPRRRWRPT